MTDVGQNHEANKAKGVRSVNEAVGKVRAMFITTIPGQEMIYLAKQKEAALYLTLVGPILLDFPFIASEVGITANTPYEVAQVISNLADQWQFVGVELEKIRLKYIGHINASNSGYWIGYYDQATADLNALLQLTGVST